MPGLPWATIKQLVASDPVTAGPVTVIAVTAKTKTATVRLHDGTTYTARWVGGTPVKDSTHLALLTDTGCYLLGPIA